LRLLAHFGAQNDGAYPIRASVTAFILDYYDPIGT
jgi:hypothetical protein